VWISWRETRNRKKKTLKEMGGSHLIGRGKASHIAKGSSEKQPPKNARTVREKENKQGGKEEGEKNKEIEGETDAL